MSLSNEERIAKLEELLSRIESRRGGEPSGQETRAAEDEDVVDLADDDVIELTDDDEVVIEEDVDDEEVPMIPEEFSAESEEPPAIEISDEPGPDIELEPLAPSEPGEVSPEALAAEPVEAIEMSFFLCS